MIESTLTIRWYISSDKQDVLYIDERCYLDALTHTSLTELLRDKNTIAIVAEDRGHILGYCIYRLSKFAIKILRLGVDTIERRNGFGTAMIDRLKYKLRTNGRDTITIDTPGVSLAAQLFLSQAGFVAEPRPNDMIRFTYDLEVHDA